jgi:hypothetical protein
VCFINEFLNSISQYLKFENGVFNSISILFHHSLWLLILKDSVHFAKIVMWSIISFIIFGLCNLFFFEGWQHFNYYTFTLGAFLYLILFIIESFYQLKRENFTFFLSNNAILLLAPVLFFIGLSFMFAFKSKVISTTIIFGSVELYTVIIYFVNIVYYSLINLYIYREKKVANEF